ncbi:hypothetical protein M5689_018175 [Euphorbia peplus]|nr:hypothetical protein M5689_018175 [Euphorbia peplus]
MKVNVNFRHKYYCNWPLFLYIFIRTWPKQIILVCFHFEWAGLGWVGIYGSGYYIHPKSPFTILCKFTTAALPRRSVLHFHAPPSANLIAVVVRDSLIFWLLGPITEDLSI